MSLAVIALRGLPGFVSQTITDIRDNVCDYLNSLKIGVGITVSALYVPIMSATVSIKIPTFSVADIFIETGEDALGTEDMIGEESGISRLLDFEPDYTSPLLPNNLYRLIIRAKISLNQWDGSTCGIYTLWNELFADYRLTVQDNQDMTMTLRVSNLENLFESEFIARGYLALKPEGVLVNYEFVLARYFNSQPYIAAMPPASKTKIFLPEPGPGLNVGDAKLCAPGTVLLVHTKIFFDTDVRGPKLEEAYINGTVPTIRMNFNIDERSD